MATKKIEENIKKTAKEVAEKKEKTVIVNIPIDKLNPKDNEIIVGINEKYAKIIKGVDTEVSIPVYEQLVNAGLIGKGLV